MQTSLDIHPWRPESTFSDQKCRGNFPWLHHHSKWIGFDGPVDEMRLRHTSHKNRVKLVDQKVKFATWSWTAIILQHCWCCEAGKETLPAFRFVSVVSQLRLCLLFSNYLGAHAKNYCKLSTVHPAVLWGKGRTERCEWMWSCLPIFPNVPLSPQIQRCHPALFPCPHHLQRCHVNFAWPQREVRHPSRLPTHSCSSTPTTSSLS